MVNLLRLSDDDNVAVAISALDVDDELGPFGGDARDAVPAGHKVALDTIAPGQPIVKYGQIIGFASEPVEKGEHVHVHNVSMGAFDRDYAFCADTRANELVPESDRATFMGYRRPDGKSGTRNYIGIVTSVNCSATVALQVAREIERRGLLERYPNVDGVVPIVHGAGCCIGTEDESFAMLQRTIWGHARHPNFAAVLALGLGCETNQIGDLFSAFGAERTPALGEMTIQAVGGVKATVDAAVDWFDQILPLANACAREPIPVSELTVALQCGGSDGYSGVSANPALGRAVDRLVRHGGTAILAETPEIYGAEHLLTRRARDRETGEKLIDLIRWWEDYAARHNSAMNNNPTPGNKAGGLTTILEKSLGAVAKAGSTSLQGVYRYAESVRDEGLVFMDSPGYDPCSITGEVASGANLVCFTTGRGSVYGNRPSPCLKLVTNTPTYEHMRDDMDINCGTVLDGTETLEALGDRIFDHIVEVASGTRTKSEQNGLGECEFVPWQTGAQM